MNEDFLMTLVPTTIAGLSTMLGCLILFFKPSQQSFSLGQSFTCGFLITISIFDLLPSAFDMQKLVKQKHLVSISFIFGCFFCILIEHIADRFFSEEQALNDMYRGNKKKEKVETHKTKPYASIFVMSTSMLLHNLPEGLIVFAATTNKPPISTTLAIAFHNIIEGASVSLSVYWASKSIFQALIWCFFCSVIEPIANIVSNLLLAAYVQNLSFKIVSIGFVVGLMITMSVLDIWTEVIKNRSPKNNSTNFLFLFGSVVAILILIFSQ
eukprot:TRINITY_DN3222_c1_g6_i1.p1 TRINITY_DN3222_c1_g6~~TRINITY_DN3222_c1_g6_i1.p1  ORF type:complete len:268 (+),score=55.97 TRINITY_DN3222_c1_g6_i1:103-906(+)